MDLGGAWEPASLLSSQAIDALLPAPVHLREMSACSKGFDLRAGVHAGVQIGFEQWRVRKVEVDGMLERERQIRENQNSGMLGW